MISICFRIVVICAVCTSVAAHAAERTGVVVAGDATLEKQVAASIESWLRAHGHDPIGSPLPADAVESLVNCFVLDDDACARGVIEARARADSVMVVRLKVSPGADARSVELTGYWFRKRKDTVAERRFCEACTDQTLRVAVDDLMTAMTSDADRKTGHLKLASSPSNARVMVDGHAVGVTPLDYDLPFGNHELALELDGHEVETRTIAVREGETLELDVPLEPAAAAHDANRPSRVLPAVLVVGGLAMLGTGIAMLAIDEDPSPQGPLEIRNTGPAGAVLTAAGAVAVVIGGVVWFKRGSTNGPTATVSTTAAMLGWRASF